MDWINTEVLKQVLQVSGVSGLLVFSIFGLIKVFSNAFAKKDEKFVDVIASINNQFMQFIERERIQHNSVMQKNIEALTLIQQELCKSNSFHTKQMELIEKLLDNIAKLERSSQMNYAEIKAQQSDLLLSISEMVQKR